MGHERRPPLLFSIDLEEFYPEVRGDDPRSTPLEDLVDEYLSLLERSETKATFFVVGDVARCYPHVVRHIADAGHELGCHGDSHVTLDRLTPAGFREDLESNREAVEAASGARPVGFRAPILSLTEKTSWAHDVLRSSGFAYSSSVLAAPSPLYGWPEFGRAPRHRGTLLELPVTLMSPLGSKSLPLLSGTYFRVAPWQLVKREMSKLPTGLPLVCYFHPYDIDYRQPWTMHAGVSGSRWMNHLLFARRRTLLKRLRLLLAEFPRTMTYQEYTRVGRG